MNPMLEQLSIAKPCAANWDEMSGDERSRHCGACKLNVYNLAGMTREEAENLIREKEGNLCVRLFKRSDGTVITQDCPVGLARIRKRMAVLGGAMAASLFLAAGTVLARMGFGPDRGFTPSQAVKEWLNPPPQNTVIMGKIAMPRPVSSVVPSPTVPTAPPAPPTPVETDGAPSLVAQPSAATNE